MLRDGLGVRELEGMEQAGMRVMYSPMGIPLYSNLKEGLPDQFRNIIHV